MAKFEMTTTLTSILDELDHAIDNIPEANLAGLKAQEEVIQDAIRKNYVSAGGAIGDYVYDSIGQSQHQGDNGVDAVGTVGVYKIDSVMSNHGRESGKSITAPQIAYWLEWGTSRLTPNFKVGKKINSIDYPESSLNMRAPKPFVSASFYNTIDEQQNAYKQAFISVIEG